MRIVAPTTLDELAPYADDWDRLSDGMPFRSWTWLWHWWQHYGPQNNAERLRTRLAVLCVFDDSDSLMGVAPWYLDSSASRGRVLRPLGSGEVCSDYQGVLCHRDVEETVVEALAEYLMDGSPQVLGWDRLELGGVDAEDRTVTRLAECLSDLGATVHRRPGVNCWRLDLPADWNTYVASLGKNMRRDVRRLEREVLDADRAALHAVMRLDELPRAMDILVELHQRRRTMLGDAGCFASARFLGFYRRVVPELLRRGQVQFYWLELDGKPVAAEYQLVGNGTLYAYQAGVDCELMECQPGKLINLAILRRAIEHGYLAFDFLRGDEPYKARFGARPRPTVEYRIVPRRLMAQFRHNLWLAGRKVKEWVRNGTRDERRGVERRGLGTSVPSELAKNSSSSIPQSNSHQPISNTSNP
jgi:CelD/BcsL family acetyltransferase involved in cellulose biosynthesis